MSHILPNFLQVRCSSINIFYLEIGIIQFGAPKLKICPKHPIIFSTQNHNLPKIGLPLDKFLGLMGSKFEYTYLGKKKIKGGKMSKEKQRREIKKGKINPKENLKITQTYQGKIMSTEEKIIEFCKNFTSKMSKENNCYPFPRVPIN